MTVAPPALLVPDLAAAVLAGSTERYEKRLSELAGIYRDDAAFRGALAADDGSPVYWVESSVRGEEPGALTIGLSVLKPGRVGEEYAVTRGHIHSHHAAAELYFGLAGRGVMLMETLEGESRALEITPGVAVHVPGHWVHRSVNVGDEPFITLFCYPTDAGQDYEVIERSGGMRQLVVADGEGWATRANPDHMGYRVAS